MAEETKSKNPLKTIVIILSVVAIILLGVLAWVTIDRGSLIKELNVEKDQLTTQIVELQSDYSELSTDNDTLQSDLNREKEKLRQLVVRVKETNAANRAQIRKYQKEVGTLRTIMKHYIVQIDSLNTLNITLRKDAELAREKARKSEKKYQDLTKTTKEYAKKVEQGAVIKGRGITLVAINRSAKETNRSSRAVKLKTDLFLVENSIAKKGLLDVYIRVKDPDGILMTTDAGQIFNFKGEKLIYSAKREVDYQGAEIEVSLYFSSEAGFRKGVYTVDAFTEQGELGSADLLLK